MFPLSDNDMDQFSREAAEQFQPEPTAAGWDALEKSLDKEMPTDQERKRRRLLWILLPFLLIGSLSGWWYWSATQSNNDTIAVNSRAIESTTPSTDQTRTAKTASGEQPTIVSEDPSDAPKTIEPESTSSKSSSNKPSSSTEDQKQAAENSATIGQTTEAIVETGKSKKIRLQTQLQKNLNYNNSIPSNFEAVKSVSISSTKNRKNNQIVTPTNKGNLAHSESTNLAASEANYKASLIGMPLALIERPFRIAPRAITPMFENQSAKTTIKIPSKSNFKPGFSISLVGGFDYSAIHGTKSTNAGFNSGLLFQYDLNKRWSIVSGGIFTKKFYEALPQNFNPPKHYWTTYVTLHYVEGFCEMIDIPINIRYNAFAKNNTRLYASAGVSSYIMTHQNYDYYYTRAGQYTQKNWDTKSQSNYWFGVANISAGVEQKIGNKFSVELEPFIKVPIQGVGFGQMDITTYGAMFHLKYQPRFK